MVGRNGFGQARQRRLDALDRRQDVRPGLASDDHQDRPLAIDPGGQTVVLDVVGDAGDVAQADGCAVLVGNDQPTIGVRPEQLIVGRQVVGALGTTNRPLGLVGRRLRKGGSDVFESQTPTCQSLWIDLDPNRGLLTAADHHLTDAFDLRDLLRQDAVRGVEYLRQGQSPRLQGQDQNGRIRRIHLAVIGQAGQVRGQLARGGVDGRLNIARGGRDLAIQIELHRHGRRAECADRRQLGETRDATEAALERRRHRRGHGLGAGPREGG